MTADGKPLIIVHYNHTAIVAGAERVLLNLLPDMGSRGCRSIVLCPEGRLEEEAKQLDIETQRCDALQARFTSNPFLLASYMHSLFRAVQNIRQRLRCLQPDVVHANSVRAGLVATIATIGLGTPVVWHVHDTLPTHPLSWIIRIVAAGSSRTSHIAVSLATTTTFAGLLFRKSIARKTVTLHNVAVPRTILSTIEERTALRAELNAQGRFLVGCIGQICPRKNQVALVELFAQVLQSRPDAMLIIVGAALFACNEPYENILKLRVQELGLCANVLLLGKRSDVPLLLDTLDLLVLPSRTEPFSMILLEAMAASLPIVAFAVDGVPELITDGRTGWLVPANDTTQMTRRIIWAARSPKQRERIAAAACKSLAAGHSPARYADSFATILKERCSRRQGSVPLIPSTWQSRQSEKSDQAA